MATSTQPTKGNGANGEHPVSDNLAKTLHNSVDALHETTANAETTIRDKSEHSKQAFDAQVTDLKKKWYKSELKRYASENPIATAGVAFTIGVLTTLLVGKK